jgi:hypothetical protein
MVAPPLEDTINVERRQTELFRYVAEVIHETAFGQKNQVLELCRRARVRFVCRAPLFVVTGLPEACPTVSGDAANGGSASAGLGEDDDNVLGASADPADAVPLFTGLESSERLPRDASAPSGRPSMVVVAPSGAPAAKFPTGGVGSANLLLASTGRCDIPSFRVSDENGVIAINLSN